jgi:hypothetical protein
MGSKSAPKQPDYTGAAEKQGENALELNTQQTYANRPTQNTPWGSSSWESSLGTDPATGKQITNWTQNITLSPAEQAALDSQMRIGQGLSSTAEGLLDQTKTTFANPLDYSGFQEFNTDVGPVGRQNDAGVNGLYDGSTLLDRGKGPDMDAVYGLYNSADNLERGAAPTVNKEMVQSSILRGQAPTASAPIESSIARPSTAGFIQRSALDGAIDFAEGPEARELSGPSRVFGQVANANETNALAEQEINANGAFQQRFADEAFSRQMSLQDPLMQREKEALETKLRNQGLRPDSEAYQNAMGDLEDQQGEIRSRAAQDALRMGSEEQSRQFDREFSTRQQGVQEIQQQFDRRMAAASMQDQQRYQEFNEQQTIDAQRFDQELRAAGFNDQQRAQMIQERLADNQQQFMMQIETAKFQEAQRAADMAEKKMNADMQFGQGMDLAGLADSQRAADMSEQLASREQMFSQELSAGRFQNDARDQDIQQRMDAAGNLVDMGVKAGQFQNDMRDTDIAQRLDAANQIFNQDTTRSNQAFDQNMSTAEYQNQVRQAQIAEALQQRGMSLNEINALLTGNQVNMPNMPSFQGSNRAETTDYTGAAANQGTFLNNRYATALSPVNSGLQALGSWGT